MFCEVPGSAGSMLVAYDTAARQLRDLADRVRVTLIAAGIPASAPTLLTLRIDIQNLFHDLGIETQPAAAQTTSCR